VKLNKASWPLVRPCIMLPVVHPALRNVVSFNFSQQLIRRLKVKWKVGNCFAISVKSTVNDSTPNRMSHSPF